MTRSYYQLLVKFFWNVPIENRPLREILNPAALQEGSAERTPIHRKFVSSDQLRQNP
jgi:hypothetical protein